jgi:hypothetical protein
MADPLARALTNPLRSRLLYEYRRETTSPSRLAAELDAPLNLVSYHTKVLAELGCIELVRTARRRGATEHYYRSPLGPGMEDEQWARLPLGARRMLTRTHLESILDEVRRAVWRNAFDDPRSHLSRMVVELDDEAQLAVARLLRRLVDDVAEIEAACRARGDGAARARYELVALQFEAGSAPELPDRLP